MAHVQTFSPDDGDNDDFEIQIFEQLEALSRLKKDKDNRLDNPIIVG